MAKSSSIRARLSPANEISLSEKAMMTLGQNELAHLVCALRLQNPYPFGSTEFLLWQEQSQINIPLLIHASLYLNDFCQKHGKKRVLFTSRDGCLWIQIFQTLFPQYDSIYFHASRYMYKFPSRAYIEYVRGIYNPETLIVDGHGKGETCEKFFSRHLNTQPTYLAIINSGKKHYAILRTETLYEEIERLNYDLCGTLYDFQDGKPLRCNPEYTLGMIYPMHACVKKCIELIGYYKILKFNKRLIKLVAKSIKSGLVLDQYIFYAKYHCHILKNGALQHIHIP